MVDLRHYSREVVNFGCAFYALQRIEIPAKLLNMSESGILLELDNNKEILKDLRIGDIIKFQTSQCIGDSKPYIFQEVSKVVRIEEKSNKIRIACMVSMRDTYYQKYISDLKAFRHSLRYNLT